MNVTDENLISGCQNGNRAIQKNVFEKYVGKLSGICQRYFPKEQSEEILNQTFLNAFRKLEKNSDVNLDLYGFLKNILVQQIKAEIVQMDVNIYPGESADVFFDEFELGVDTNGLMKIIQGLDNTNRFIFNLILLEEFTPVQVAEVFQISEQDVRRIYNIAKSEVANKSMKKEEQLQEMLSE